MSLPTATRILLCTEPQDMRRSFDTLAAVVRDAMGDDPQSGALFIFLGKSRTRAKVLWWEKNGYCLLYKRLHRALFRTPSDAPQAGSSMQLDAAALAELLAGVEQSDSKKLRKRVH